MKRILFLIFLINGSMDSYSQVAINYYPFQSILSISSNCEKLFFADIGMETNTFFSNVNFEAGVYINIKRTDWVNYYSGFSMNTNLFYKLEDLPFTNGYAFKVGARIKPIQSHKNVQMIFELSPYFNRYFDGGMLRTLLGISYSFNKT